MKNTVQEAIEVLRHLPDEKAQIAAAAIITFGAAEEDDVEREVISF